MDNKQIKQISENLEDLNIFFEAIGFDKVTLEGHFQRLGKLILVSANEKLEKIAELKDKALFPEMKSMKDFLNYYEQYIDKATIEKIMQEEAQKVFTGYFNAIGERLPK